MSRRAIEALANEPYSDVFIFSHGWQGDVPGAIDQYDTWIRAMTAVKDDIERARQIRPGFQPLLIGLHWPSLRWGEEALAGASFAAGLRAGAPVERLVDAYAARLADTPAARAALQTIVNAAMEDVAPPTLPSEVREAYAVLNREAGLESEGPDGSPGADTLPLARRQSQLCSCERWWRSRVVEEGTGR